MANDDLVRINTLETNNDIALTILDVKEDMTWGEVED
jgi:hypothetical protein